MKKYILLILLVSFYLGLQAKDLQRVIAWSIPSDTNFAGPLSSFSGATINENNLPVYSEILRVNKHEKVRFTKLVYSDFEGEVHSSQKNGVSEKISISPGYSTSGEEKLVYINFIPIRLNGGKIQLLESFNIEITKDELVTKSIQLSNPDWKSASVLASGKWVKIKTSSRGIHKITHSQLSDWGFSDPQNVNLYGNGGYMMPKMNDDFFYDDLAQNSVWHGQDGSGENCMFFYSTGTVRWNWDSENEMFCQELNDYSDECYYYLGDVGNTKLIESLPEVSGTATHQVTQFTDYLVQEDELYNLIESGREWYGDQFGTNQQKSYSFNFENLIADPIKIWIQAVGRSSKPSSLKVSSDGTTLGTINFQPIEIDPVKLFASSNSKIFILSNPQTNVDLQLQYVASNSTSDAWLNFITLNYTRDLILSGSELVFRDKNSHGDGNVADFQLKINNENVQIWNITDYTNPKAVSKTVTASKASFKADASFFNEFVAFYPNASFPSPEKVEDVSIQDLHGADLAEMIIISHPLFIEQANELSQFHQEKDGMSVAVVQPQTIYNEFSSGIADIAGIRNFLRMCYNKSTGSSAGLKYVLLFGDGSFDNKNIMEEGNNLIPTYQSPNSLKPTESFVTDDFFALLDEGEGEYIGLIDLGIGRIPASTTTEAQIVVNKIKNYVDQASFGDWRNVVCFIGDDETKHSNYHIHIEQADEMADYVNNSNHAFFTDKIYFDAYTREAGSGGDRYPDVTEAINRRVKNGALILNYTGHANQKVMADENVLGISEIDRWSNSNKLPIFVTATCEISRFDADEKTAGEHILFNPNGGGIGLFSTTRLVFSGPNFTLNKEFYKHVFSQDEQGENLRMGEIMKRSKNGITGSNKRNFTLLADPALKLSYPKFNVVTETINGKAVEEQTETISSLSTVTVTGRVTDNLNNTLSNFNGELIPTVYDKMDTVQTMGNGGETPMEFKMQSNVIYKGVATVTNGNFEFTFIVPKDISYAVAPGKISYYADNGVDDAHGYSEDFFIGGASSVTIDDNTGPDVKLYLNDDDFQSGDEVGKSSILFAEIQDDHGINTVGTGIGHDITAVLDGDYSNIIVLNDFYLADKDSYQSGKVVFPLLNLEAGEHTLLFKVWDVLNNSEEIEITFVVTDKLILDDVYCYPNPVKDFTNFVFEHNRPDEVFDTKVEVYDMTGKLLDILTKNQASSGNKSFPMLWQVNKSTMLYRSGMYIFRITIVADDGASASKSGRMVITEY